MVNKSANLECDYFSKPNAEEIFDKIYELMGEAEPGKFPDIY